jgi:predicted HicB family RNase H-like nuclease
MFKIEKEEYANKTFRMPKSIIDKLNQVAIKKNISMNKLIILCCEYALENLENESEKE